MSGREQQNGNRPAAGSATTMQAVPPAMLEELEKEITIIWGPLSRLLRSRRVLLAVFGLIEALVLSSQPGMDPELWKRITDLVMFLIGALSVEDVIKALKA